MIAHIFSRHLEDLSTEDIVASFDFHIMNGRDFPVVADIREALAPKIAYRMNSGPKGFDALYSEDHPYVRLQAKLGQDISRYAEHVSKVDADRLRSEASYSPVIEFDEDDKPAIEPRTGSGFHKISFVGPK